MKLLRTITVALLGAWGVLILMNVSNKNLRQQRIVGLPLEIFRELTHQSPRSEKMTGSKEAMVRWLKVQDAPFGSFHGENLFLCFWIFWERTIPLYNWIQRNYTIIIPPTSQLWRWWCLGGVRPKSLAKRKEDEDTSRHFSGGDASYIQENSWLLVIEAYEILKSGVHPWVNRSTLFTNSLRFAHPQRCHQVSLSPSNKSSSTNHSSCSHPPGRWPSAWTPRWIGCRAGPNWRQSRCGAVVLAGTHPYFQRLKR